MKRKKAKKKVVRQARTKKPKRRAIVKRPAVRKNPIADRELNQAIERFTGFRGDAPRSVDKVRVRPLPRVMLTVGDCLGIMYRTERDGVVEDYLHRFKQKSRPTLAVASDGKTLYLLGGAYRVTDRGIEDT